MPQGNGVLYSGQNEIVEGRFDKGMVPSSKSIKIILADGCYYEGNYQNHQRQGAGVCYYPNGDIYEGLWVSD